MYLLVEPSGNIGDPTLTARGSCDFRKRSKINGKISDKAYDEVSIVFD